MSRIRARRIRKSDWPQRHRQRTALATLRRQASRGIRPTTVGTDKGYHCRDFIHHLHCREIRPHLAQVIQRHTLGLDGRTMRHTSDRLSQR